MTTLLLLCSGLLTQTPLEPGNHLLRLTVDDRPRSYLVHLPPRYDPTRPTPIVLVYHGALMNGPMMVKYSGLSDKADEAGFVAVYPNGTGAGEAFLTWNSWGLDGPRKKERPDDVKFTASLLDDLATRVNVDPKRVYACGMSNGGMMCYRLAAELADRIAAIAPVAGTLVLETCEPKRPISVIHFHGTTDPLVPFADSSRRPRGFFKVKTVEESVKLLAAADECPPDPEVTELPDTADDQTTVKRTTWGPGKENTEVILYTIAGGGHTWPGQRPQLKFLGPTAQDISANDLIWEFFEKHQMP
ncbi:MAG: polyhydroxybutyrate depolymerase [Planctomycetaceae bacterium]|nr:polyhydroxybutyrate depolymerase [Planctomycetaceae bacterium]